MSRAAHTQSAPASTKTGVYILSRSKFLGDLESGTRPSLLADGIPVIRQHSRHSRQLGGASQTLRSIVKEPPQWGSPYSGSGLSLHLSGAHPDQPPE